MSRFGLFLLTATVLLRPGGVSAQPVVQKIEAADRQTVTALIGYEVRTGRFAVNHWTAFMPEPPELPSQTILKTTSFPAGKVVAEKSPLARKVRFVDFPIAQPVPGSRLPLRLEVHATLRTRKLVALAPGETPPQVAPLTPAEKKFYVAPSPRVDYDRAPFREWLAGKNLRRKEGEAETAFAARVLAVIRSDYGYSYNPFEDKRASVSCNRASTDCGGMSFIFVGAMRANDIPARVLVGRLARPRRPGVGPENPDYEQPHIRAEFFVGGVGWVPVDPTYANANKKRPVEAFVGHDPGDMLVLHADLELKLPFADKPPTVDMLQIGPYFRATGVGPFDAFLGPTGWEVEAAPAGDR